MVTVLAYVVTIDIWPDHMAVSPSLIAGRTFRPLPNIDDPASDRTLGAISGGTAN
jgi:hypothetical protein